MTLFDRQNEAEHFHLHQEATGQSGTTVLRPRPPGGAGEPDHITLFDLKNPAETGFRVVTPILRVSTGVARLAAAETHHYPLSD